MVRVCCVGRYNTRWCVVGEFKRKPYNMVEIWVGKDIKKRRANCCMVIYFYRDIVCSSLFKIFTVDNFANELGQGLLIEKIN